MEAFKNLKLVSLFLGGLLGGFGFLFAGLKSAKAIDEFLGSMKTNRYGSIAASIFAFIVSGVAASALVKQTTS